MRMVRCLEIHSDRNQSKTNMNDLRSVEKDEWNKEPDSDALELAASIDHFEGRAAAFKALIDKGSVLSMINLAQLYEYRPQELGVIDFNLCEEWYARAVDSQSALAAFQFGYFYLRRSDYASALKMFSIGAERDYAPAIVRLANFYIEGIGVNKNIEYAKILLRRANFLGNIWAKRALARIDRNTGCNVYVRWRGIAMSYVADFHFYYEKSRNPESERLKK